MCDGTQYCAMTHIYNDRLHAIIYVLKLKIGRIESKIQILADVKDTDEICSS